MLDRLYERFYNFLSRKIKTKISEEESIIINNSYNSGESIHNLKIAHSTTGSCIIDEIRKGSNISEVPDSYIKVLNGGYVGLVNVFGDELDIVNAARVSYDKQSDNFDEKDERLLRFLIREGHTSPFRHVSATFECYVPLMVARQHWKYAVASTFVDDQNGWNESSRRYITEASHFYIPENWRTAPENSKQGSGVDLETEESLWFSDLLRQYVEAGQKLYDFALGNNIAPEQARLFLPAYGMFLRYRWTVSLAGVMNFLDQRLADDAQYEIQQVALAVYNLISDKFPTVFGEYYEG